MSLCQDCLHGCLGTINLRQKTKEAIIALTKAIRQRWLFAVFAHLLEDDFRMDWTGKLDVLLLGFLSPS